MSAHDAEQQLASVDLFAGLSKRQLGKLRDRSREVRHTDGQEVAHEGLGALAFHLVLDGRATVTLQGREVRTLGPGDYFGEISMIDGKSRSATITATEGLTTMVISHEEFDRILGEDADFARALLVTLCARLREAESRTTTD
jgi:CRP/FNR family transcriptional regulator, cyclic AMP receptor protein